MRGVVFDLSLPRYALAKGLGRWAPSLYHGPASCLRLDEVAEPKRPGPGWVKLASMYSGLCGSDLALIYFKSTPVLQPFSSMPCVLGHEILARVTEASGSFREGDRVVVDPLLPCSLRGMSTACAACARGEYNLCESFARGHLAPGMLVGFHRDLPGGWGDRLVAHESQLFRVPESVPDKRAALTEPLAVGVHAVLKAPPRPEHRVLVVGGGMIAFSVLSALRLLELHAQTIAQLTLYDYQAELGRALGATATILLQKDVQTTTHEICQLTGATSYQPLLGDRSVVGGFDRVYDCVGTRESLTSCLRYARAGAKVVLVGAAAEVDRLDWTYVWSKELTLVGTFCYSREASDTARRRTFEIVLDRLGDATLAGPIDRLVTHEFPLEQYREAVIANVERDRHRSVKTLFALALARGG